jgi:hypothetical protein
MVILQNETGPPLWGRPQMIGTHHIHNTTKSNLIFRVAHKKREPIGGNRSPGTRVCCGNGVAVMGGKAVCSAGCLQRRWIQFGRK